MAAEKKYYWLRLQKDFFKRHDLRILEAMENGKDYALLYMKLLLESIDHEGELRFSDTIPYNDKMLATITNTNVDIVRSALIALQELGMLEILDDETIYMTEVDKMIGKSTRDDETREHDRIRQQRHRQKMLEMQMSRDSHVTCHGEIEKEIKKEQEIQQEKYKNKSADAQVYFPNDEKLDAAFKDYIENRKKMKSPMTDRAKELAKKKLMELANNDNDTAIAIINQSILNGWKGLFELKGGKPAGVSEAEAWLNA